MPTYDYKCATCGREDSIVQTMAQYTASPQRPSCCAQEMGRRLSVNPLFSGLANAMAGDRHYDGMRASDGTDISSRTKHREYMKSKGLATADDFTNTWKKADADRQLFRTGQHSDKDLHAEIESQVLKAVAQPD